MKYLVNFFVITFLLTYSSIAFSTEKIVYINMKDILNKSLAGDYINNEIKKIHSNHTSEFKIAQQKLKDEENKILAQKNILSESEYKKKVNLLKKKIKSYQVRQNKKIDDLNNKRIVAKTKLLDNLNIILTEYSKENDISFILKKEDIIVAKKKFKYYF